MDEPTTTPLGFSRRGAALLALLVAAGLLAGNFSTALWDQDEAAYAGFARTMLRTGDLAVPRFTWSDVHRKPPLLFWAIAGSFRVLGENGFALRLPTVLAAALAALSLAFLARRRVGPKVAATAAAVLATSLFVPNLAKVAVTDSLVLLFDTVAVLSLWNALEEPAWRWTVLYWAAIALGLLAKGPPVLVVAGGAAAFAAVFHPRRRNLLRLHPWLFLPLALTPLCAWGWVAWRRTDGALVRWMLDWYVLRRATSPVFGQRGPPGYYLASFFLLLLPWSALLPAALGRLWRDRREPDARFLWGWLGAGWIAWELLMSKLPTYAIGAYPALALLIAREVAAVDVHAWARRGLRIGASLELGLAGAVGAALVGAAAWLRFPAWAVAAAVALAAVLAAASVAAFAALRAGDGARAARMLAVGASLFTLGAWLTVLPAFEPWRAATREVAAAVDAEAPGAAVLVAGNYRQPSLPFYLGAHHADVEVSRDRSALAHALASPAPHALVMDDRRHGELAPLLAGAHSVRIDGFNLDKVRPATWWVVVNAAALARRAP